MLGGGGERQGPGPGSAAWAPFPACPWVSQMNWALLGTQKELKGQGQGPGAVEIVPETGKVHP